MAALITTSLDLLHYPTTQGHNVFVGHDADAHPKTRRRRRRHIPHAERLPEAVARRNARERRRVDEVNNAFLKLQCHLPEGHTPSRGDHILRGLTSLPQESSSSKKFSKIKILQDAIDYIAQLSRIVTPDMYSNYGDRCDQYVGEMPHMTSLPWLPREGHCFKQETSCQTLYPGVSPPGSYGSKEFQYHELQGSPSGDILPVYHGNGGHDYMTNFQTVTGGVSSVMIQNHWRSEAPQQSYHHTQVYYMSLTIYHAT